MSIGTKCALIALFLLGILASWLVPDLVLAVHDTHAFSMYREFDQRGMINHEAVDKWRKRPGEGEYSIDRRMQEIGGLHTHLPLLSWILTGVFTVSILCVVLVGMTEVAADRKREEGP